MIVIIASKKNLFKTVTALAAMFCIAIFASGFLKNTFDAQPVSKMNTTGYVAIVIDDFGNGSEGTEEMINLEMPFTGAVMPGLVSSAHDAEDLHSKGKEVILHMPMEAHNGKKAWLGPKGLTTDLSTESILQNLQESVESVPHILGINNHMGSKATEDARIMAEVLKICKENSLFFLDSKTSSKSKAKEIAAEIGVTVFERDVFLDGTNDVGTIEKNLQKTADVALKHGFAIAIGHVGNEGGMATVKAIQNKYKELRENGIVFVKVSELEKLRATQ